MANCLCCTNYQYHCGHIRTAALMLHSWERHPHSHCASPPAANHLRAAVTVLAHLYLIRSTKSMMVEWRGAIRCINFGGTDENATDQMRGAALVVEKRNTENEDSIDGMVRQFHWWIYI